MYIDFHTHHVPQSRDVVAVVDGRDTWGIHPWRATEEFSVPDLTGKIAIGECGLDACCGIDLRLQKEVLTLHVALADATARVLILHCVKALDLLLKMRKDFGANRSNCARFSTRDSTSALATATTTRACVSAQ